MIRILLLDDDPNKIHEVKKLLLSIPDLVEDSIIVAPDIVTAQQLLTTQQFDLIILDILLPHRFGDQLSRTGGYDFLREIIADDSYKLPFHLIGLTEFDDIKAELSSFFTDYMWHLIRYDAQSDHWRLSIANHITYLVRSKSEIQHPSNLTYDYDIAIVTALHHIELENVLKLDANWMELKKDNDHTVYHKGTFVNGTRRLRVVAASASQMGMPAMGLVANKMVVNFRPKYIIVCGIAAGIKGKGNFGDILIPELSWDYGSGKIATTTDGDHVFLQDPRPIPLTPDLFSRIQMSALKREFLNDIQEKWHNGNGIPIQHRLNVVTGPFATGSYVIENLQKVQEVVDQNRKLIGIDMETYAVFYTANNISLPRPIPISMRSICDYGDNDKKDDYQKYAGFTSANYLYYFSLQYL